MSPRPDEPPTPGSPAPPASSVPPRRHRPCRAAVLGSPIAHSLSPALHRAAYQALGLAEWTYGRFQVEETGIGAFLEGLGAEWAGLSLTMPLKRAVIPLLDEVSPTAASVEAVNTVVFAEGGRRRGENTDIPGIVAALRERGVDRVERAAILGAGATASSALAALTRLCAGEITVYVRTAARAVEMRSWGERLGARVRTADWAEAHRGLAAPLVVATTPAGATDSLAQAVPPAPGVLFDVLYDPWPTPLAAAWESRGGRLVSGLDLLVHQAVLQVELMTGLAPGPLKEMREAGEAAVAARHGGPAA
ncbi:shikimate dehydrogenase [Streptomyces sp. 4N509B]|uniref:shikimate dehydrogenase n=1 Tax=Streptomyces sp. 4N509B TaxID=3457413 RepID=UPI003FCF3F15